jgi:hypothetical protein
VAQSLSARCGGVARKRCERWRFEVTVKTGRKTNGFAGFGVGLVICMAVCWPMFSRAAATPALPQAIRDGQALLTAMHDRYKGDWYESVVFKENAITLNDDGTSKTQVWDEALEVPGKLRINRGPSSEGNGIILDNGTLTTFQKGKATGTRPFIHMLLVLGFDVYGQEPQTTMDVVKGQGYDLALIHEEKWDGEDVYVVGAAKGDLKSKQFWVEKKRLLFVRVIAPDDQDATKIHDTRFLGYKKLSKGWLSERVEFYTNGKDTFNEDYFDVKAGGKLDPSLFDPAKFNETKIFNDAKR